MKRSSFCYNRIHEYQLMFVLAQFLIFLMVKAVCRLNNTNAPHWYVYQLTCLNAKCPIMQKTEEELGFNRAMDLIEG